MPVPFSFRLDATCLGRGLHLIIVRSVDLRRPLPWDVKEKFPARTALVQRFLFDFYGFLSV